MQFFFSYFMCSLQANLFVSFLFHEQKLANVKDFIAFLNGVGFSQGRFTICQLFKKSFGYSLWITSRGHVKYGEIPILNGTLGTHNIIMCGPHVEEGLGLSVLN